MAVNFSRRNPFSHKEYREFFGNCKLALENGDYTSIVVRNLLKMSKVIAILADFPHSYFKQGAQGRGAGQSSTWLTQLADEFVMNSEFVIHWITLDRSNCLGRVSMVKWNNQTFWLIPSPNLKADLLLHYQFSKFLLARVLRKIRPDLIHCWGSERAYPSMCGWSGIPSVFSVQGVVNHLVANRVVPANFTFKAFSKWEKIYLKNADVVTVESSWAAKRVSEVNNSCKIRQIEYGANLGFSKVVRNPNGSAPYALFVGNLSWGKGVDLLIEIQDHFRIKGWQLRLAGYGPLAADLSRIPGDHIKLLGNINWDQLKLELSGAMCLIHPTRADSSPNSVKEARAAGLPVITSTHGGQTDYIIDGENGFIVDPLNATLLIKALNKIMDSPEVSIQMGSSRLEEDRAHLHPARSVSAFLDLYRELLR